ncbi:Holliday junction resolvase RuvX [uncultured Castellaniella sp.]|jgi:putative Holliday junction resolvase|uniref:Holliday junction resolvase RuvX n=1 Tax=uncultured Castellaniella sp. TaxID=647907 RepID=UPI00260FC85B|nr:Holliday junction resolvase RuvX [uncultured Castellaniella sp.]
MPEEVLLAFDFGLKKIGVAVGNTLTAQARPLCILTPATRDQRFARIRALLDEWQPDRVVVGLPLTQEGGEQPASQHSRRFAHQLEGRFRVPVELVDERGSSLEAQRILGSNDPDDAMAAAVILQRYLDRQSGRPDQAGDLSRVPVRR